LTAGARKRRTVGAQKPPTRDSPKTVPRAPTQQHHERGFAKKFKPFPNPRPAQSQDDTGLSSRGKEPRVGVRKERAKEKKSGANRKKDYAHVTCWFTTNKTRPFEKSPKNRGKMNQGEKGETPHPGRVNPSSHSQGKDKKPGTGSVCKTEQEGLTGKGEAV